MKTFFESALESIAHAWLEGLGWRISHANDIAPDWLFTGRFAYREVTLTLRLRDTLLPKLISGELQVKDAERFLKERGL